MILLYLLLGHLIADFLLQPSGLIKMKFKHWYGILIHVLIHLVIMGLLTMPYLLIQSSSAQIQVFQAILLIIVSHFIIDYFKINYEKKHRKYFMAFWLDQFSHYTIIAGTSMLIPSLVQPAAFEGFFPKLLLQVYLNPLMLVYCIGLVFLSFTIEISGFERLREKNSSQTLHFHRKNMLKRVIAFSSLYLLLLFFITFIHN